MIAKQRWAALAALIVAAPASAQTPLPFAESVRAGDLLFLSGQIGAAPGTGAPVAGGVPAETRQAMTNIGAALARRGLGYGDIVKCTVMLTDMTQWAAMNRVYASFFAADRLPARSAIGATALALGAKVEIECIAHIPPVRRATAAAAPLGPYSPTMRSGDTVYVSGVIAYDAKARSFAAPEISAQMKQVLANLDEQLAAAHLTRDDIVKTTLFLRKAADMPAANQAYAAYFAHDPKPARTTVPGVDWGRPDILVELEAVAVAGPSKDDR